MENVICIKKVIELKAEKKGGNRKLHHPDN